MKHKPTRHQARAALIGAAVVGLAVASDGGADGMTITAGLLGCAAAAAVAWWDYAEDMRDRRQAELDRRRRL